MRDRNVGWIPAYAGMTDERYFDLTCEGETSHGLKSPATAPETDMILGGFW